MGIEALNKLRSEAPLLPEVERAELAHTLMKSLDAPAAADAVDVWDNDILHRLAELDAGTAKLIDRDEFRRRMHERLGKRWCARYASSTSRRSGQLKRSTGMSTSTLALAWNLITRSTPLSIYSDAIIPLANLPGAAGDSGAKRLILKRFPYDIVVHQSRRPEYWRDRS